MVHPYDGLTFLSKKQKLLIYMMTEMNFKYITLSETSHTQRLWSHYDTLEKEHSSDTDQWLAGWGRWLEVLVGRVDYKVTGADVGE